MSHFTEPMRFIIISKRSLGLFCFKIVNILTPLIVSIDVLLTINMSKTYTSTRIYTLDIYIWKDRVLFPCKNRYLGYNETSAITRTFARSQRSRYSRVPLYKYSIFSYRWRLQSAIFHNDKQTFFTLNSKVPNLL